MENRILFLIQLVSLPHYERAVAWKYLFLELVFGQHLLRLLERLVMLRVFLCRFLMWSVLWRTQRSLLAFRSLFQRHSCLPCSCFTTQLEKRFWTHAAVVFAVIYTVYCTMNYVVQLTTVIPAGYSWTFENQQGTLGPLSILNQTPHSLFWDLDGLGYIFLNLATLFAFPVFEKRGLENWVRRFFLANALITPLFAIVYFYPTYSVPLLLLGGIPWVITVPGCLLLLALYFGRK